MSAIIVDIDGTIADCRHRRHFVNDGNSDWKSFFDRMYSDAPIFSIIEVVNRLNEGNDVYLVTARPESHRELTIAWLNKHNVSYDYLFMREEHYLGTASEFKESVLRHLRRGGINVFLALEDKQECVDMWRLNGVLCLQNSMKEMP